MFYARFIETVESWPDAIALEMQRAPTAADPTPAVESYTYTQLRAIAESVGAWIASRGISGGARCAFLAANSPLWTATYIGVVSSGNTAVPLDTAYKPEQLRKLLLDCGAVLLFVDDRNLDHARAAIEGLKIELAMISGAAVAPELPNLDQMIGRGSQGFQPIIAAAEDTICILYTSGTTSDPKGVMLTHGNLVAEMDGALGIIDVDHRDALLGVLPLFHALAQMANLLIPLAIGARVVYLDSLNTSELLRALRERKITIFCCVPQFFYLIHERVQKQVAEKGKLTQNIFKLMMGTSRVARRFGLNPGKIFFGKVHELLGKQMRYLITGGSRFDLTIGRDLHAMGFNILQAYGLTETSGGACVTPPKHNVIGSIGKPFVGAEIEIHDPKPDENGRPVGELKIRGGMVMKGYYNRPDATAAVLRDGWFYSGDLGYKDTQGNLYISGRAKEIIVLSSGKNIYPEEIEAHYLKSPFIKELCVMGLESKPGEPMGERLHAAVVPNFDVLKEKKIVNVREVIRFDIESLSAQQPSTKRILSYDIWQEDLPRTTTRKLKRFEIEKRTREMHARGEQQQDAPVVREITAEEREWLDRPEVQQALAIIRTHATKAKAELQPSDNLELDLGLDSMERVEMLVEIEQALGADVPDSVSGEIYSVRELVDAVLAHRGTGGRKQIGWDAIFAEPVTNPEVLAVANERPIAARFWYAIGRVANLASRDLFHLKITGLEKLPKSGPFIISPNHQSFLDAPVLMANMRWSLFRNLFFVGTSEIWGDGLARKLASTMRLIPIDPDANLVPAMQAAAFGLKAGRTLVLYPEGERSIDGPPKTFKKGAAILAAHLQVPIYPIAIEGFHEAWPRGKGFQKFARLQVAVCDPVVPPPGPPTPETYERLTAELREKIVREWERMSGRKDPRAQQSPVNVG
ncbi:AMP-dependent synthetase and ligase [Candidatus Koribacter versatilis Ellin345]|uniref:AMP-dependent synthetase and ligase n=1 Tax=Koribacter versatilis (strain Ellin345) TaxID=204669 RepID=Q1IMP1_KORVE|nr:AMP-binding protein [Candidatus Koribacter versatilis]ABF41859.1 AMP-dependent synthetase and ligase [Candidatus Koribacter versatilis Ellin345]